MKKLIVLLTISTLSTSVLAEEKSWLDSLKNLVGLGEAKEQSVDVEAKQQNVDAETLAMPSTDGLVDMLTSALKINTDQASAGMGAILNYVKNNVSTEQFSQLAKLIPEVDELVSQMPDISKLSSDSSESMGGLLDKASEYSDSLKSMNDVKKQFEALGLKPEMINNFISSAQSYLDTEQGQQAKQMLTDVLGKLLG
ncbi:DUF2780 domain-containing protein [Candidatus Colwellia aromaticivorans]|uniref:DUF2780 domain-containing protein n=1 Tax=Candidatus Colwellia aromaticivorans TaxID=2267621 RepID=UPI000DF3F815|nr:DUF2780 domain-containing protein [Candidatus Colwellia aromaticivorans]